MRRLGAALVLALASACGAQPAGSASRSTVTASGGHDYEVHEWGLVRADTPGDVLRAGAVAPQLTMPLVVLKPVLYFHAPSALRLTSVTVRAAAGGSLAEVWPLAPFDTTVRWDDVSIDPTGACAVSPLPSATDAPCSSLPPGDFCEASGLAVARTSDGACVTVGSSVERFLFYRARVTRFTPPLAFQLQPDREHVRVTNEGTLPIPGFLVRIHAATDEVRALAFPPPTPGAWSDLGLDPSLGSGTANGASALHASLIELGLTEPEASAFLDAWTSVLFAAPGGVSLDLSASAPVDSVVYFLPEASADDIATLELSPAPRAVRRAMAVWSVIRADGGASH